MPRWWSACRCGSPRAAHDPRRQGASDRRRTQRSGAALVTLGSARGRGGRHPDRRAGRAAGGERRLPWLLAVTIAVAVGILMPRLDEAVESGDPGHPLAFVFGGGPAAARDLLAAVAGSLISVTGVMFSLTVVALQLGSSQYLAAAAADLRQRPRRPSHAGTVGRHIRLRAHRAAYGSDRRGDRGRGRLRAPAVDQPRGPGHPGEHHGDGRRPTCGS
jgi:hypothetical protein